MKSKGSTNKLMENAGAGTPANPIHHCTKKNDGTDYTDFSYVYFGSYPQSEVTDRITIAAIDDAIDISQVTVSCPLMLRTSP